MADSYTDVVHKFYEAWANRDEGQILELLHPDVELRTSKSFIYADHSPYKGRAGVHSVMERLINDWDLFRMIPEEIQGAGDMVIARGRYLGTYLATGDKLNAEFVHVFKFQDGKIMLHHTYTDTAQFRDVVGADRAADSTQAG